MSNRRLEPRSWDYKLDPPERACEIEQGFLGYQWDSCEVLDGPPTYAMVVEWAAQDGASFEILSVKCKGTIELIQPEGAKKYRATVPFPEQPGKAGAIVSGAFVSACESDSDLLNSVKARASE